MRRTRRKTRSTWDTRADTAWKWLLRLLSMVAFSYVLISEKDFPLAVYVLIGGMAGLPSIWSLQSILNERAESTDEDS